MNYMTCGLDCNDCREVVRTCGKQDGALLGYVIRRPWVNDKAWFAYRLDAAFDLVFQGRYATSDEAAARIG